MKRKKHVYNKKKKVVTFQEILVFDVKDNLLIVKEKYNAQKVYEINFKDKVLEESEKRRAFSASRVAYPQPPRTLIDFKVFSKTIGISAFVVITSQAVIVGEIDETDFSIINSSILKLQGEIRNFHIDRDPDYLAISLNTLKYNYRMLWNWNSDEFSSVKSIRKKDIEVGHFFMYNEYIYFFKHENSSSSLCSVQVEDFLKNENHILVEVPLADTFYSFNSKLERFDDNAFFITCDTSEFDFKPKLKFEVMKGRFYCEDDAYHNRVNISEPKVLRRKGEKVSAQWGFVENAKERFCLIQIKTAFGSFNLRQEQLSDEDAENDSIPDLIPITRRIKKDEKAKYGMGCKILPVSDSQKLMMLMDGSVIYMIMFNTSSGEILYTLKDQMGEEGHGDDCSFIIIDKWVLFTAQEGSYVFRSSFHLDNPQSTYKSTSSGRSYRGPLYAFGNKLLTFEWNFYGAEHPGTSLILLNPEYLCTYDQNIISRFTIGGDSDTGFCNHLMMLSEDLLFLPDTNVMLKVEDNQFLPVGFQSPVKQLTPYINPLGIW